MTFNPTREVRQPLTASSLVGTPPPALSGDRRRPNPLVSPFSLPSLIDGRCPCTACVNDRRRDDEQRDLALLQAAA